MLLLVGRILRSSLKEVFERLVQMPQGLLGRHTRDLIQPGRRRLLLPGGQGYRGIPVEEVFPTLPVGVRAQAQSPVIDEPRAAKRPGQHLTLARGRITTVLVGAFLFHTERFFLSPAKPAMSGPRRGGGHPSRSRDGCPPPLFYENLLLWIIPLCCLV